MPAGFGSARRRVESRPKSVMPKVLTSLSDRGRCSHNNNNNNNKAHDDDNNNAVAAVAVPTYRVAWNKAATTLC